jgi:glucosamine 6-phosphate synthetase-like amidotransferase/phosphosugar isomerase protein
MSESPYDRYLRGRDLHDLDLSGLDLSGLDLSNPGIKQMIDPTYISLMHEEQAAKEATRTAMHEELVERIDAIQGELESARKEAADSLKKSNRTQIIRDILLTLAGVGVSVAAGLILHYGFGIG